MITQPPTGPRAEVANEDVDVVMGTSIASEESTHVSCL